MVLGNPLNSPWELYILDPQIFYVLFQILYIRFTPYTFS